MKECNYKCSVIWVCLVVISFALMPLAILNLTHLKKEPLPEPPVLKLSDYPKTQEHCEICSQCRTRWDLIEKNQITWDSPACCSEGFEIGMQEFREKLKKVEK